MEHIHIRPVGVPGRLADRAMRPLMFFVAGTVWEEPQATHRWNNRKLTDDEVRSLHRPYLHTVAGDRNAVTRRFFGIIPRFHLPIIGGWRRYVVIEPQLHSDTWYLGWIGTEVANVSRVPVLGAVRTLRGPLPVNAFGIDSYGNQILLMEIGTGVVGEGGPFAHLPLL